MNASLSKLGSHQRHGTCGMRISSKVVAAHVVQPPWGVHWNVVLAIEPDAYGPDA